MKADDLITFFVEEAQHHVISAQCTKNAESALAAQEKKPRKGKGKREKSKSSVTCENCGRARHTIPDCWSKGGGKEGQGPRQKKSKKGEKRSQDSAVVASGENEELFAFTCTSDYAAMANTLQIPKE